MPASESLAGLVAQLRAMSPRAQRAILRSLTKGERAILADYAKSEAHPGMIETGSHFSPWIASRIRQSRTAEALDPMNRMTGAAQQALLRCAGEVADGHGADSARRIQEGGRSLFDSFGGFMSQRGFGR